MGLKGFDSLWELACQAVRVTSCLSAVLFAGVPAGPLAAWPAGWLGWSVRWRG